MSNSLQPHESQCTRPPCPSPTPGVYSNSCPSSQWCHPAILSSVVPFSCPQSLPASGSFTMSQFFPSGGQSTGVSASASVFPMNTQDWSPLASDLSTSPRSYFLIASSVRVGISTDQWGRGTKVHTKERSMWVCFGKSVSMFWSGRPSRDLFLVS